MCRSTAYIIHQFDSSRNAISIRAIRSRSSDYFNTALQVPGADCGADPTL